METIKNVINFLVSNWGVAISGILLVLAGLAVLAKITKTPKDDEVIEDVTKVVQKVADLTGVKKEEEKK